MGDLIGKVKDLTGMKFGRWTVIKRGENDKWRGVRWWCQCDCGNPELRLVKSSDLTCKKSLSCGCISREKISRIKKKYNEYNLDDEYGIGYTNNTDSYGRNEFYFDLEDYDKIKDYCWYFDSDDYLRSAQVSSKNKILLHQIILPTENGYIPDHIHGKETRNDNRKCNLRIVTHSQNRMNKGLISTNISGVTGVGWNKQQQKWRATITKNYKRIHLGSYDNFEDAVKARKEAEEKYFGEYSYDNSMNNNEDCVNPAC